MAQEKNKKGKALFFYPNFEGDGGIPNGMALLSGCLREAGFETRCFDVTFLSGIPKTHLYRQEHGGVMKADHTKFWAGGSPELAKKAPELFLEAIVDFKPDLIAVSMVEVYYNYAISVLSKIKEKVDIPVVAGGVVVTASPDMVITNDCIDAVCVGEGEDALVELANRIAENRDYDDVKNIWVKKNGKIIKNPLRELKDMDSIPFQDWSIFDKRHYYKPYCGEFRRTGFIELARGCPFNCSFCITASLKRLYSGLGKFIRTRDIDSAFDEIIHLKDRYGLELIFFIDDNFLGMPRERFDYFCGQYRKRIKLPFYIQTRSETVKEEYIKELKETNISTIGIGVEHGHEGLRKQYMNRHMDNANLKKAFDIVHKYDIRTTANIMIGMPYEKESMFVETVKLLQKIKPKSFSINYFQPYRGTLMRDMAVELGCLPRDHVIDDFNTCLDMPSFSRERITHYYKNFTKYVNGELKLEEGGGHDA